VKRARNLAKHGLDFSDAWLVYENPLRLDAPSRSLDLEPRRSATAPASADGIVCVLVYVLRGDVVRCISFRKASRREREEYGAYEREVRQLYE
jgi:uncharacterized DUF497 family protein